MGTDGARRTRGLGLVASALLAVLLGLLLPRAILLQAYVRVAPSFTAVELLALFAWLLLVAVRPRMPGPPGRGRLLDAALAGLLTAIIALVVPASLRVQSDESNLAATSFTLLHHWTPESAQAGVYDAQGVLHPSFVKLDKRGLLYPEMLLPFHAARGFDPLNGTRLNLIGGALSLWLLITLAGDALGRAVGRGSAILLAATPSFALAVRSGGFDVVNLAALLATLLACAQFMREPVARRAWTVVLCAAVLAQLRYESILPAAAAMAMVGMLALSRKTAPLTARALSWPALCAPGLLLPALWRHAVPNDLETSSLGVAAFSLGNAQHNLGKFLVWLFAPDHARLGLPLLGWLLVLATLQAGWRLSRGRRPTAIALPWLPLCAALGLMFFITIAYWWGQATAAATVRLFLPWLSLACVIAAQALMALGGRGLTLLVPLAALAWRLPVAAEGLDLAQMKQELRIEAVVVALQDELPNCRTLILDQRSGVFIVRGWSSMPLLAAVRQWSQVQSDIDRGLLDRVVATTMPPRLPLQLGTNARWSPARTQAKGLPVFWQLLLDPAHNCPGKGALPSGIDPAALARAARPDPAF